MADVFVSYKREERDIARQLADALEKRGWSVWWDPNLRAGEHFDDVIEEAIMDARCVIVLWSARSIKSRYVKDEAAFALQLEKLVPVAIDDTPLPLRFKGLHTIQLQRWTGSVLVPAFEELLRDIEDKIGRPAATKEVEQSVRPEPSDVSTGEGEVQRAMNRQRDISRILNDSSLGVQAKALLMMKRILVNLEEDVWYQRARVKSVCNSRDLEAEATKLERMEASRDDLIEKLRAMEENYKREGKI